MSRYILGLMVINHHALKALRERSGYTIRGLAEASGVSKSTISAAEQGERNPSPSAIKKLAEALAVPTVALLKHLDEIAS